jgi:DNA-binding MarR family transcriptional regulator
MSSIEQAIQQKKFKNEFLKADINIMYTASWLALIKRQLLSDFQISWQQFNILRILKGQHPNPSPLKNLSGRMIDRTSNTSRLVDKLVEKGYVERRMCPADRRKVDIIISDTGIDMLEKASQIMEEGLTSTLSAITEQEARTLNSILDKIRT